MTQTFQVGDKVKLLRKAASHENGWKNSWVDKMDLAVGKVGTVTSAHNDLKDVYVDFPEVDGRYGYPSFALELVPLPAPSFKVGDRVEVTYEYDWDGDGVVREIWGRSNGISVDLTTGKYAGQTGTFYPRNLKLIFAPAVKALRSASVFGRAKTIALELGKTMRYVHIDLVQTELQKIGIAQLLGNAAGSVFRGKDWRDTGRVVRSTRPETNRRKVTVWEYQGPVTGQVPEKVPPVQPVTWTPSTPPKPSTPLVEWKAFKNLSDYKVGDIVKVIDNSSWPDKYIVESIGREFIRVRNPELSAYSGGFWPSSLLKMVR